MSSDFVELKSKFNFKFIKLILKIKLQRKLDYDFDELDVQFEKIKNIPNISNALFASLNYQHPEIIYNVEKLENILIWDALCFVRDNYYSYYFETCKLFSNLNVFDEFDIIPFLANAIKIIVDENIFKPISLKYICAHDKNKNSVTNKKISYLCLKCKSKMEQVNRNRELITNCNFCESNDIIHKEIRELTENEIYSWHNELYERHTCLEYLLYCKIEYLRNSNNINNLINIILCTIQKFKFEYYKKHEKNIDIPFTINETRYSTEMITNYQKTYNLYKLSMFSKKYKMELLVLEKEIFFYNQVKDFCFASIQEIINRLGQTINVNVNVISEIIGNYIDFLLNSENLVINDNNYSNTLIKRIKFMQILNNHETIITYLSTGGIFDRPFNRKFNNVS